MVRTNINLISDSKKIVGGVLGYLFAAFKSPIPNERMTITKCYFDDGNIDLKNSGSTNVGGFLGLSDGGGINIADCGIYSGTLNAKTNTEFIVGGFIGEFYPSANSRPSFVTKCFSMIDIVTIGVCQHFVGGFMAQLQQTDKITACYATGTVSVIINGVSSAGSSIGGLVGYSLGTIENCYALGNVLIDNNADNNANSTNTVEAGGLVGHFYSAGASSGIIKNCFSAGKVNAQSKSSNVYSGGIVGLGYTSTSMINTAALGVSVTANGNGTKYVGRISGSNNGTSANSYALNTMLIEDDIYNSVDPSTRSAVSSATGRDGQDTNASFFFTQSFWKTTLNFPEKVDDVPVWDFSSVGRNGYPRLTNVGGQQ